MSTTYRIDHDSNKIENMLFVGGSTHALAFLVQMFLRRFKKKSKLLKMYLFLLFIVFFQIVVVLYFVSLFYQCNYFLYPEEGTGCPEQLTILIFRVIMHFQCFIYLIEILAYYLYIRSSTCYNTV